MQQALRANPGSSGTVDHESGLNETRGAKRLIRFPELDAVRRAIVIAPHPDDETIGAFGLICRLKRAGAWVRVVIVTDGAASHKASLKWTPSRLCGVRKQETLGALRLTGLNRSDVTFLNFPDGMLSHLSQAGRTFLAQRLAAGPQPDLVIRPDEEDAHSDHRAVGRACADAWPARVRQLSYTVWPAKNAPVPTRHLPLGGNLVLKQAALRLYRSQTGMIDDDPAGFCIDRRLTRRFLGPSEAFRETRTLARSISS